MRIEVFSDCSAEAEHMLCCLGVIQLSVPYLCLMVLSQIMISLLLCGCIIILIIYACFSSFSSCHPSFPSSSFLHLLHLHPFSSFHFLLLHPSASYFLFFCFLFSSSFSESAFTSPFFIFFRPSFLVCFCLFFFTLLLLSSAASF